MEHGVEILLRFLKTHCAKLPLPDLGSHLQGFFFKLKREKYESMASWNTRYTNEYTNVRRAMAGLRRAEEPEDLDWQQTNVSPQVDLD